MENFHAAILAAHADIEAAGLEVGTVGAAGEFAVFLIHGRPVFNVVFLGGRCAKVTGGDIDDAIGDAEFLPDFFFNSTDLFVHGGGVFGQTEDVHF